MGLFDSFASASKKIFKGGKKEGDSKSGEQPLFTPPEIDVPTKESNVSMNQSLNASVMANSMVSNAPRENVETNQNTSVNPTAVNTGFDLASPNPTPVTQANEAPAMSSETAPDQSLNSSIMTGSMVPNTPIENIQVSQNADVEPAPVNPAPVNTVFGFASPNSTLATPMNEAPAIPSETAPNQSLNSSIMTGSMVPNAPIENVQVSQNVGVEPAPDNPAPVNTGFGFASPNPMSTPTNEAPTMPSEKAPNQSLNSSIMASSMVSNTPTEIVQASQNVGIEPTRVNPTPANTGFGFASPNQLPTNPTNEAPAMPFGQGAHEFIIPGGATTNTPNGSGQESQNIGFVNPSINPTSLNTSYDRASSTSSPVNETPVENTNVFTNPQSNIPAQDVNTFVNKSSFVDTSTNGTPQIANPIPFGASYRDANMQNGNQQRFFTPEEPAQTQPQGAIPNNTPIDPFNINQSNQENQVTPFKTM